jgi:hypothetical protein
MKPCIIWAGKKLPKGYGHQVIDGVDWLAHRWAYTREHGPIPQGVIIRHTCDNPSCIEPSHLIAGTYLQNMQDAKDRGRRIGCKGNSLREDRIAAINAGLSNSEIALIFNTSRGAISKLRKQLEPR